MSVNLHIKGVSLRHVLIGTASYVPGLYALLAKTGGTDSARYCYTVWLRHLVSAYRSGCIARFPELVAELGPGDSLGTGIAALISGADRCYAFDVVRYAAPEKNLCLFDEIVELFRARTPIPGEDEFPEVKPKLSDYAFPEDILTRDHLEKALAPERLREIRTSIANLANPGDRARISYVAPWESETQLQGIKVDMIFSQAVLEHVDDLDSVYRAMRAALRPEGFISHQIDFRSHRTHALWNGHWTCSPWVWKMLRGNRPYLINREPFSAHRAKLEQSGFEVRCLQRSELPNTLTRDQLSAEYRHLGDDDLSTSGAYIVAVPARCAL